MLYRTSIGFVSKIFFEVLIKTNLTMMENSKKVGLTIPSVRLYVHLYTFPQPLRVDDFYGILKVVLYFIFFISRLESVPPIHIFQFKPNNSKTALTILIKLCRRNIQSYCNKTAFLFFPKKSIQKFALNVGSSPTSKNFFKIYIEAALKIYK